MSSSLATSHVKLWTCRKHLQFTDLQPCVAYTIPVFVSNEDAAESYFTDTDGKPLPCSCDYIYEALDHCLYWVRCDTSPDGVANMHLFCGMYGGCGGPRLHRSSDVLELADFFRGGRSTVLASWSVDALGESKPKISTESFTSAEDGGIGSPPCEPEGQCLWIEPGDGTLLRRSIRPAPRGRVHLRAHFYDDGEQDSRQWMGVRLPLGRAAVGLLASASDGQQFYGFVQGEDFLGGTWKRTFVPRTVGWHMFEMVFENQQLYVVIDSEPIAAELTVESSGVREEVLIFSSGASGYGVWAGAELFYTPAGQSSWALGSQQPSRGCALPWELVPPEESAFWQDSGDHVIERISLGRLCRMVDTWARMVASFEEVADDPTVFLHPAMEQMVGTVQEIIEERADGMTLLLCPDGFPRWFPPGVQVALETITAAAPHRSPEDSPEPPLATTLPGDPGNPMMSSADAAPGEDLSGPVERGIAMECWSEPAESDREQIERVVAHFVELLLGQGVLLPDNIRLVAPCREAAHKRCFVYRFGTRRLHFQARSADDGRLALVVRCGGGFMDFVDFARRHGGLEQAKLRKQVQASDAVGVNRFVRGSQSTVNQR